MEVDLCRKAGPRSPRTDRREFLENRTFFLIFFEKRLYKPEKPCYNTTASREGRRSVGRFPILQLFERFESEAILMVTVLFVVLVLVGFSKMLSVLDNQRISSSVSDYLRNEYSVCDARHSLTVSSLRNL